MPFTWRHLSSVSMSSRHEQLRPHAQGAEQVEQVSDKGGGGVTGMYARFYEKKSEIMENLFLEI